MRSQGLGRHLALATTMLACFVASTPAAAAEVVKAKNIIILIADARVNKSNFFKGYALGESICFICVVVAYALIFWFAPAMLIRVSKLAGYVTYTQVPLTQGNMLIYQFFPYYLTVAGMAILFFMLRHIKLQQQFDNNELEIKRQIDAAVVTSRAFCHFMKNEVLSIQSEIELFEVEKENQAAKEQIIKELTDKI